MIYLVVRLSLFLCSSFSMSLLIWRFYLPNGPGFVLWIATGLPWTLKLSLSLFQALLQCCFPYFAMIIWSMSNTWIHLSNYEGEREKVASWFTNVYFIERQNEKLYGSLNVRFKCNYSYFLKTCLKSNSSWNVTPLIWIHNILSSPNFIK